MQPLLEPLLPRSRRAADVVKGLAKQFARQKKLTALVTDANDAIADRGAAQRAERALFETFSAYCVVSQYHLDFAPEELRKLDSAPDKLRKGESGDLGIDAWAIIINRRVYTNLEDVRAEVESAASLDVHFVLVQAKLETRFHGRVFTELGNTIQNIFSDEPLIEPHRRNAEELRECVSVVYKDYSKFRGPHLPRISVWYTTIGTVRPQPKNSKLSNARKKLERTRKFRQDGVEIRPLGAHELRELYRRSESLSSVSITMISQAELPKVDGGVERAIFGLVRARQLVERVLLDPETGEKREYLYHSNFREYLSANPVNEGISATLHDPTLRPQFPVMNNGVTILTSAIEGGGSDGEEGTVNLTDPQIVNGCQTCNVLLDNKELLDDRVLVALRVIQTSDTKVKRRIINSTNTQTQLPATSSEIFRDAHMNIEDFFLSHGDRQLLYERRLRQYGVVDDPSKIGRIVTRRELTQAYASVWLNEAHRATRYAMLEDEYKGLLYQDDDDELPYYAAASALNRVVWMFDTKELPRAYWTARFHLAAAVKLYTIGDTPLPKSDADVARACGPIVEAIWGPNAKGMMLAILGAFRPALGPETDIRELGHFVRNEQFALPFRRAVLDLSPRHGRDA